MLSWRPTWTRLTLIAVTATLMLASLIGGARAATTGPGGPGHIRPDAWTGPVTIKNFSWYMEDDGCLENSGNPLIMSQAATCQHFYLKSIGTVSGSGAWPFTPGSGLNSQWNGRQVSQMWFPAEIYPNDQVDVGSSSGFSAAVIRPISSTTYVVQDCTSSSTCILISVPSSNHFGSTYVFTADDTDGGGVGINPYQSSGQDWSIARA